MNSRSSQVPHLLSRASLCGLALALGAVLAALLLALGQAARASADGQVIIVNPGENIQDAIAGADPGDTLLLQPGHYTEVVSLTKAVSLTGVSSDTVFIHGDNGQRVLIADGEAVSPSVVISGLTLLGGQATGPSCALGCGGGVLITNSAQPRLENLILRDNYAAGEGGGLYAHAGSPLTLVNVHVLSNTSDSSGGGLYTQADITVTNSLFEHNNAGVDGGALYAQESGVVVSGSRFSHNSASLSSGFGGALAINCLDCWAQVSQSAFVSNTAYNSGGVFVNGQITLTGSLFYDNLAVDAFGGLYAHFAAALLDTDFIANTSQDRFGGGAFVNDAALVVDSTFISNTAGNHGGGLFVQGLAHVSGSRFEANATTAHGGGGYFPMGVYLTNTHVVSNTAAFGGGIFASTWITATDSVFQDNLAANSGGGVYAVLAALRDTDFISNTANGEAGGGGMYASTTTIAGGEFVGNLADGGYGGGAALPSSATISATRFLRNHAGSGGGGLYLPNTSLLLLNALFEGNTADSGGAAMYLDEGAGGLIVHNTIIGDPPVEGTAIYAEGPTIGIVNNIIASHTVGIQRPDEADGSATEGYNLYFGVEFPTLGEVNSLGNNLTADPAFVNPAAGDYRLRSASPAIDAALDLGALPLYTVTLDFEGEARPNGDGYDIGMDEHVNLPPVAAADAFATLEDTPLVAPAPGVLANDGDPLADPLTPTVQLPPLAGTLAFSPDGSFVYTPALNANGEFTFTYAISDGTHTTGPVLVSLTVTPVNDLPTLSAIDNVSVTVGQAIAPIPFTIGDVETPADALTVTVESSNTALVPPGGLVLGGSGAARTLTITPNPGVAGTTTITLMVADGDGGEVKVEFLFTLEGHWLYLPYIQH